VNGWRTRNLGLCAHACRLKQRPDIGAAVAADRASETLFQVDEIGKCRRSAQIRREEGAQYNQGMVRGLGSASQEFSQGHVLQAILIEQRSGGCGITCPKELRI
jgi:hypothetical protein